MRRSRLGSVFFLLVAVTYTGLSQIDQSQIIQGIPRGAASNYHFAEPNELTIVVNLLGEVRLPGRFEVSRKI